MILAYARAGSHRYFALAPHTMTLLRPLSIAVAALSLVLSGLANAASALKSTTEAMPATKFNEQDRALMMARVNQALGADKEGEILEWKSDSTPASGSVKALNRLQWNGMACRRLQIYNAYGEVKAQGVYKFCEKPAGKWKLVGPD
jgi:surface antigen